MMDATDRKPTAWRRVEAVFIGLLLLTPVVFDPWGGLDSQYKALYLHLMACLLVAAFLFRPVFRCGFRFQLSPIDVPFLLFMLFAAASILWSTSAWAHLQRFCVLASAVVGFYMVRIRLAEGDDPLNYVLLAVYIAAGVALIDSAVIVHTRIFSMGPAEAFKVGSALFSHDNVAAFYAVFVVPMAFIVFLIQKGPAHRLVNAAALLVLLGYLIILESRASWMETPLALFLVSFGLLFRKKLIAPFRSTAALLNRKPVLLLLTALLVLVFLLPVSRDVSCTARDGLMTVVNKMDLDYGRLFFRIEVWDTTMIMVSDHLWTGLGLGNFPIVFPAYHKLALPKAHPHSEYLNVLVELGVIGMALYALVLLSMLRAFLNAFCTEGVTPQRQALALGVGCALLVEGIHSVVETPMIFEASGLNLFFFSGILVGLGSRATHARIFSYEPTSALRRWVMPLAATAGLAFALPWLAVASTQSRDLKEGREFLEQRRFAEAERLFRSMAAKGWPNYYTYYLTGDTCYRQGKREEALVEYEKAERLFPYDYKILCKKGMVLRNLGRTDEALATLEQAMSIYSENSATRMEYIRVLFDAGQYDKAFRRMELFLRSRIPTANDYNIAGRLFAAGYQRMDGTPSERRELLCKAIEYLEKAESLGADLEALIRNLRESLPPPEEAAQK